MHRCILLLLDIKIKKAEIVKTKREGIKKHAFCLNNFIILFYFGDKNNRKKGEN
jgi:hypothetical protein